MIKMICCCSGVRNNFSIIKTTEKNIKYSLIRKLSRFYVAVHLIKLAVNNLKILIFKHTQTCCKRDLFLPLRIVKPHNFRLKNSERSIILLGKNKYAFVRVSQAARKKITHAT